MKVLVIGASSFTGKHFCAYAREQGAEAAEVGFRRPATIVNLHHVMKADYIVNFAALNVVAPSWQYPQQYMDVNCTNQIWMWDALKESKILKKYVHVSTPEVDGSTGLTAQPEPFYNPSTPYAVSRAAAEMMLLCYAKQYGLPVVFTRAANVYGPGQQLYRLIPKVIACIKKSIQFPLEGGGTSKRQFIHVKDVCEATWKVMTGGTPRNIYNIGPLYRPIGINYVVDMICSAMNADYRKVVRIVYERPGKDSSYDLNSSKTRKLGWSEEITLNDGIGEVVQWMEDNWETLKDEAMEYVHRI